MDRKLITSLHLSYSNSYVDKMVLAAGDLSKLVVFFQF